MSALAHVPPPAAGGLEEFAQAAHEAFDRYAADYHEYFARNNRDPAAPKTELDPKPRVILVPGEAGTGKTALFAAMLALAGFALGRVAGLKGRKAGGGADFTWQRDPAAGRIRGVRSERWRSDRALRDRAERP